jgi:hypothetical protein
MKGDKDAAVRSFERVLQLKPDDEDTTEALRKLCAK